MPNCPDLSTIPSSEHWQCCLPLQVLEEHVRVFEMNNAIISDFPVRTRDALRAVKAHPATRAHTHGMRDRTCAADDVGEPKARSSGAEVGREHRCCILSRCGCH